MMFNNSNFLTQMYYAKPLLLIVRSTVIVVLRTGADQGSVVGCIPISPELPETHTAVTAIITVGLFVTRNVCSQTSIIHSVLVGRSAI